MRVVRAPCRLAMPCRAVPRRAIQCICWLPALRAFVAYTRFLQMNESQSCRRTHQFVCMNGSLVGGGKREVAPLTLSAMAEATEATRTRTRPVLPTLPSFFPLVTLFPCKLSTAFSWQLDRKLHGKREREGEISEDIVKGKGSA